MKKHIIEPNTMNGTVTLFDLMREKKIPFEYLGYPWNHGTQQILELEEKQIHDTSVVFAYIDEIDHLGHQYGINSKDFLESLKLFDELLSIFIQIIKKINEEFSITIVSGHRM